jgi:putative zinc finger/helix-turn-helix YgiT family protein
MKTIAKVRPFPWKCQNCGKMAVHSAVVKYPTEIEYDGRVYSFTVDGLKTPQCRECHEVFPDAEANQAITDAFRHHAKLLTPQQIRGNRERLNLTQKQLASLLGFAEATVSRWETGAQIQQRSLDNLLRIYFGFPGVRRALAQDGGLQGMDAVTIGAGG